MKDPIAQYLARHAEPEAAAARELPGRWGQALVVPVYGERESLFALLGSVPEGPGGPVLIVLGLNARADSPAAVHEANEEVRRRLERELSTPAGLPQELPARAYSIRAGGTLLLVDPALPGRLLPGGQGVRLARKIGNDLLLAPPPPGQGDSPLIHHTHPDTNLAHPHFDHTS